MTLWILDTDHLSLLQRGDPLVEQRISTIDPDDIAITIISVEEQLYGRLNQIRRAKSLESLSSAYGFLRDTLDSFSNANILDFDKAATSCYEALLHQKIRIGTQDLKIAAIVLSRDSVLVTRNQRDFAKVPNLVLEDWSVGMNL